MVELKDKMKSKPVIIGIGEVLWDILPSGKKAGGAPINFAYHAFMMGAESYAISAVGIDVLGDELLDVIDSIGINYIIERLEYPTGNVNVSLKDGIPTYEINENVAWDFIQINEQIEELVKKADAICFGTLAQRSDISRNSIQKMLLSVREDAFCIFDINLRQSFYNKEIINQSLERCNVFKINEDELLVLKELYDIEQFSEIDSCRWFIDKFSLKYLIMTAGADYSTVMTPDEYSFIKTPVVEVVDTIGAGDSFAATFITGILNGKPLEVAHKSAVDRSALVCTKEGAWVSI